MATITHDALSTLDSLAVAIDRADRILRDGLDDAVKATAREGNTIAKNLARKTAGAHGKRYPGTFYAVRRGFADFEYGPTGTKQGDMSFERGSRNQPAHHDLANSLDVVRFRLHERIRKVLDEASL